MISFSPVPSPTQDEWRLQDEWRKALDRGDHETAARLETEWSQPVADANASLLDRLDADLDDYPNSPTLKALAATAGELLAEENSLVSAYRQGAPARLIIKAEILRAAISTRPVHAQVELCAKLSRLLVAVNRELAKYGQARYVPIVRIFRPLTHPTAPVTKQIAENDDPTSGPSENDQTTARPPPTESPASMPINRNAPPRPRVQQQISARTICTLGFDGAGGT